MTGIRGINSAKLLLSLAVAVVILQLVNARQDRIHRAFEDISGDGRYLVEWEVNLDTKFITFEVIVETTGAVGFGISPSGLMAGSDIVNGGVYPNGTVYFEDRHGLSQNEPPVDAEQNWILVGASETETHTRLKFYRLFDTGDESQDVVITPGPVTLIWAFAQVDEIEYHRRDRGAATLDLLGL